MLKGKLAISAVAFILGAFSLGALGSTAQALTPVGSGMSITEPSNIQPAATYVKKKKVVVNKKGHVTKKTWVYNRKYGPRYTSKRPGYGYYYGGYWYARPYWQPGINLCIGC